MLYGRWYILGPFGTFYGNVVHFMGIWYNFSRFDMLYLARRDLVVSSPPAAVETGDMGREMALLKKRKKSIDLNR
jgi:hypothetical protein